MSAAEEAGTPDKDEEARVVQVYLRQDTGAYCPIQVSARDTAKTLIHNAILTLGLKSNQTYSLLEVRESGSKETLLKPEERPLRRVLLWPPETQKWHPKSSGHFFVLQPESSEEDMDDLCDLPAVTETSVLEALRQRFYNRKIYTYISSILVAVNPNKYLPVYYNPKYVKMYENQPLGKLSPHIFAMADVSFRAMLGRQRNQCILLSGETGSGKTESSGYLIHCLTALSQKTSSTGLDRTILGSGPVLEAFGNAKTAENNNSSRFGKFVQLNYLESGVIRGAVIEKFLLEKSRVVSRDKEERNYHVFYYLLAGASKDEREQLHLLKTQDYLYLKQENLCLDDQEELAQEYQRLHQAMEMVGFLASTKKLIFSVLSAILLLGNVAFSCPEGSWVLEVGPAEVIDALSDLLKVKKERLVTTLTQKKIVNAHISAVSQYMLKEAIAARDSMAKSLYSALFDWIVFHINHAMLNKRDMEESVSCLSVGVLDMFGFENLRRNGFEQLCINYANEVLQHYIKLQIFKLQQEDYVAEGLVWKNIPFPDNSGCVQLFNHKPAGLFSVLDEESSFPEATNQTLLKKLKELQHSSSFFVSSSDTERTFVVQHFAGAVKYHIQEFKQRNSEHMRPDVVSLLRSSKLSFLHHLVASSQEALFRWGVLRATIRIVAIFKYMARRRAELIAAKRKSRKSLNELKRRSSPMEQLSGTTLDFSFDHSDELPLDAFEDIFASYEMKKKNRGSRRKQIIPKNLMDLNSLQHTAGLTAHDRTSKSIFHPSVTPKPPTVSAQFQTSLGKLMTTIEKAEPFFIVCLRSNNQKKELHFEDKLVLEQIRNAGMLHMIRMNKSGYGAKYTFTEFLKKFGILFPKGTAAAPQHITELFQKMGLDENAYQIGKTKVFLKEKERLLLQEVLNKEVMRRIITLQRWFRTCLIRLHFLQKRDASLIIQRCWREFYEKHNRAATVIQTAWRSSVVPLQPNHDKADEPDSGTQPGRLSLPKKHLRKQQPVDLSPNRRSLPEPGDAPPTQRDPSKERREGRPSPALNRPLSMPLGSKVDGGLRPYPPQSTVTGRLSEDDLTDESRPESRRKIDFRRKGKSMSADELSRVSSSGSDSSPAVAEMSDEPDCFRFSLQYDPANKSSRQQVRPQPPTTTPERVGFLSLFLRKRGNKSSPHADNSANKMATLPTYSPQSLHSSNQNSGKTSTVPTIRISRATRALQWDSSLDREITDPKELLHLDEFLGNQVNDLRTRTNHLSATERIFLNATMDFRETIKSMFSLQTPQIGYKDLMMSYHNKVNTLGQGTNKAEISLVVNLFQSVLDGFIRGEIKRAESELPKTTKKGRKKEKCVDSPLDHLFSTYQVNIMQSCDLCGSYIWGMEKAYMCSACKLICHKKCLTKIITDCSTRCARQDDNVPGSLHFGVHVCLLTSKSNPVPKVVELLLMHVELNGLYTEGIYRKSGSACQARELHQILQINPEEAQLDKYPIHIITGLVKRWLRELPDPLMTYSLYTDFLHAVELPEASEKIRAVYQKVDELPPANYNTLERLIFHLVRVAKEEQHNKMSPSSLAIVFAPCIMRLPDSDDPLLGIKDVPKTTQCVEILITEQLRRYNEKMKNIQQLEDAEALTVSQLKFRRQNTVLDQPSKLDAPHRVDPESETVLIERLKSIKEQKTQLACGLPDMDHEHSDSENLDSLSSLSSDSLYEFGATDSEGKMHLKPQKPEPPHRPADLAQKVRHCMDRADDERREFSSSAQTADSSSSSLPSGPHGGRKTRDGSYDDLEIPYIDEDEDQS
ncbi:unconventional myosin-IXb isoform X2 [Oryzias latipes]|uniref:unconventional myosin-IXb isoform X2 n=1 Tax=Oryzias latipes TaxID=8090 RepID=UPI0005CB8558|nr:unconventional myosin-IXb isoform X2 [Oryzias latipes]